MKPTMTPTERQCITGFLQQLTPKELAQIARSLSGYGLSQIADVTTDNLAVLDFLQWIEAHNQLDRLCFEVIKVAPRLREIAYLRVALREEGVI